MRKFEANMKLMQRLMPVIIMLGIWICACKSYAQTLAPVTGITYNNRTSDRVAQVTITNLHHHIVVFSNDLGVFTITAAPADTLMFSKPGFTTQRLIVEAQKQLLVYLVPALQLEAVTVKAKSRQQEQKEVMDSYRSQGTFYNGKPSALAMLSSPITGLYELFGKTPGRARHFNEYMQRENQQTQVNKRYTHDLVKRITKLPDDEVQQFMLSFSPSFAEILKWNDYELIQFINRSLAGYNKAKTLPRLTSLKGDTSRTK
jgi:hypothetical protein